MPSFRTIMVATDFTPLAEIAHDAAYDLIRALGAQKLHFEHVVQTSGSAASISSPYADYQIAQVLEAALEEGKSRLADIQVPIGNVQVTRHARLGGLGRELALAASEQRADLVVVASHGHGALKRAFLGSAASGLVRAAPCPVLIVGEQRKLSFPIKQVLTAIDLSPVSGKVLANAFKLASPGAEVKVLSVYELPLVPPGDGSVFPDYLTSEVMERWHAEHSRSVQTLVDATPHPGLNVSVSAMAGGRPAQTILDATEATHPQLLVIGTSGHSAWHRLVIGSTATRVLNEAKCPVLVVPNGAS